VPGPDDLFEVGVVGAIARMIKVPDGTMRILVQGGQRVHIDSWVRETPYLVAEVSELPDVMPAESAELEALMRNVQQTFSSIVESNPYLPEELQLAIANIDDPSALSHLIAGSLRLKAEEKQGLLEEVDVARRLRRLVDILARELEVISIGSEIQNQVQSEIDKGQREFVLRQQLDAIRRELGEFDESAAEANELREQLDAIALPEDVRRQVDRELKRLESLPPQAAEHGVIRTYLEWIASLPWDKTTEDNLDLSTRAPVLDEDHYDIEQVKDRIIEFLAVRKLKPDARGSILCFVGPPGVGKTSLGRSIARASGASSSASARRRARRGRDPRPPAHLHRRDARDDHPRAARRGVQEPALHDRRDRQDGRRLPRRSRQRDARGARPRAELDLPRPLPRRAVRPLERHVHHHRQHARHDPRAAARPHGAHPARGLHRGGEARDRQALSRAAPDRAQRAEEVVDLLLDAALRTVIRDYTREAGVRNLEREIGTLCRKVARQVAESSSNGSPGARRSPSPRARAAGPPALHLGDQAPHPPAGVATGLAWTPVGGDVLFIEATAYPGEGKLTITGQLGDVMRESAQAALSYVRSHLAELAPGSTSSGSPSTTSTSTSRRRDAEGRAERRHHDGHRARVAHQRAPGARRRRDDRARSR
jgi:ATP-dependent Lon protease